jgi:hypothetical protein
VPVALTVQKSRFALHLVCAYADSAADQGLRRAYVAAGKELDMGRSCLRFNSPDDVLPDAVSPLRAATAINSYIAQYEASRGTK